MVLLAGGVLVASEKVTPEQSRTTATANARRKASWQPAFEPPTKERVGLFPSANEGGLAQRVAIMFEDLAGEYCIAGFYIGMTVIVTIIFSVVVFLVESLQHSKVFDPGCEMCKPLAGDALSDAVQVAARTALETQCAACGEPESTPIFLFLETICIIIFTVEYIMRFGTAFAGTAAILTPQYG